MTLTEGALHRSGADVDSEQTWFVHSSPTFSWANLRTLHFKVTHGEKKRGKKNNKKKLCTLMVSLSMSSFLSYFHGFL